MAMMVKINDDEIRKYSKTPHLQAYFILDNIQVLLRFCKQGFNDREYQSLMDIIDNYMNKQLRDVLLDEELELKSGTVEFTGGVEWEQTGNKNSMRK